MPPWAQVLSGFTIGLLVACVVFVITWRLATGRWTLPWGPR